MKPLRPPVLPPSVPPSNAPGKPRVTWESLVGKPASLEAAGIAEVGDLTLHATGKAALRVQRDENTAAVRTVIEIRRNGSTKGFIGLDASDHVVILAQNGTTVLAEFDTDAAQNFALQLLRDATAGVRTFLAIKRQGVLVGYLGSDGSDRLAFIATDGTTVIGYITNAGDLNTLLSVKSPHLEATTDVKTPKVLDGGGLQVLAARKTGWGTATGTATRTTFDTTTVTLSQLAERMKALIDDLHATAGHGVIGT